MKQKSNSQNLQPKVKLQKPKFEGKGTRARLNTAAEKKMFGSKFSL